ncbi:MBG domain-containing protein [Selenomonas dianae]|uniref:YDG domain-containing protein n=1 Tax=Selenomonas dianae TaxID=135079 RepID=A0ABN0SX19_9FIRM|nr:MBG domain-containing protein [Selenomonas dianae]WLD82969.1 MBG domain-containing protein [Selenomonas dianae]
MSMMRKQRRSEMRRSLRGSVGALAAGVLMMGGVQHAYALPQGGQVAAGAADIAASQTEMAIRQSTQNAVINWNTFNIAANERVNIYQPNAQAALLNRVLGGNPSEIFGTLSANGRVFLVNPAGVLFAPGAQVNAGSILASTMNITNADFMAGKYAFVGTPTDGKIINRASLIAKNEGTVALLGKNVVNEGVIVARKGAAVLAAGEAVSLDFNGDGKVSVVPTQAAMEQAVTNKGLVEADGGLVFMSAATGDALTRSAVNQEGIVRAASLDGAAGSVRMTANDVRLAAGSVTDVSGAKAGTVEIGGGWQGTGDLAHAQNVTIERGAAVRADATEAGNAGGTVAVWSDGMTKFAGEITARGKGTGAGGAVETSGAKVQITGSVNASSEAGKGGEWLIDPEDIEVKERLAGDPLLGNSMADVQTVTDTLNNGTSVSIQTANYLTATDDNSITVSKAITKTAGGDATLSLKATGSININDDITSTSGKLNVDITSDTNKTAGGSVSVANGKSIKTLGGNVKIGGGLVENGVGFANSQSDEAGITLNHAVINTTDAGGTAGGNVELAGSTTANKAGVSLSGTTITAGTGKVTLAGKSTGGGKGISIDGGSTITTRSVELRTDSLDLAGTITGDNDPSGSAKVWTLSDGKTINFGTGSGGLDLAGDTFSSTGKIKDFHKNIVGDAAQKANITASGVTADNDLAIDSGAGTLTVSDAVSDAVKVATGHALTLGSKHNITGAGVITADTLALDAAAAEVSLTGTNAIGKLDGKAEGLTFRNGGNLTVGGETGLVTAAGGADIEVTAGNLTIGTHGMMNGAGAMKLKASGTLALDANAKVNSTGTADTSFEANIVNIGAGAKVKTTGGKINVKTDKLSLPPGEIGVLSSANGAVTIETKSAGTTMSVAVSGFPAANIALASLDFIDSGTGAVQLGNADTGNIEIGATPVNAPLSVVSHDTIKVKGAVTNTNNKDISLTGNTVNFDAGSSLAAGSGKTKIVADEVQLENGTFSGTGVFAVQKKTAGNFDVGGASTFLSNASIGKLAAGDFSNVAIGAKDNAGTATIGEISALPQYTSILTNGALSLTGTVHGGTANTLALHGTGLTQTTTAGFKIGKLLLLGKGDMKIDSQRNEIENIAADLTDTGSLTLTNKKDMNVAMIENRNVDPPKNVEGIEAKSTHIKLDAGKKLNVAEKIKTKENATLVADDMNLGNKMDVGKTLTLEKADNTQAINVGKGSNDWNIDNAKYDNIKIGGNGQSGNININGATFKKPSDIETTGDVKLTGETKAGADGKSDMKIKAHAATLPTAADTLAVKNLTLDLSGGIDLGLGKVKGDKDGKITTKGADSTQNIVISDNASDAGASDFRIAYRTINDTLTGFKGFDVAGEKHVYFYGGSVKKSINAAGKEGVEVRGNLTIEGVGTKLKIGADTSKADHDPASVITGGFTVKEGMTVHVKGSGGTSKETGAEINIQTGGNIHLEKNAKLMVEGNYAQATLNARNGDVVLNEKAKVQVAPGSTPVWVDVTGNKLQLDKEAQLNSGDDTVGALRVHTDEIVTPTADDNTTNIVGKSGLVITRKTNGNLTLNNNSASGAGLHITSDQLNGKLFGNEFSELVLGDNRSNTVTIDGLTANNRVVVKTAETGKTVIGAGGLNVGPNWKVTLTTGAIENSGGAGVMNIGAGSALNLYTNNITNLVAHKDHPSDTNTTPSVTGTGTLGISTYNGSKTIGLGDGAAGDLQLTNDKFTNVFGPNFSHYSIGRLDQDKQSTINVAGSNLKQDATLQANNINFTGDLTLADDKTLTVNANTSASQTAGKVTASNLALLGGNIALDKDNAIGTLAADAYAVSVKSDKLKIGTVTTPAGASVLSRTISGVKAGSITSGGTTANGNIKLAADKMTFDAAVEGKGALELEQATAGTALNVGKTGTGLTLGADLFGGNKIKDGFEHIYLGRKDVSGDVNVGGTLNFLDPTTIRSGETSGKMNLDGSAKINTNNNSLNLASKELKTAAGSEVNTGMGDLTLKTDNMELNGKMKGKKALNILPLSHNRDIKLGGSVNEADKLSLLKRYFSDVDRTFWEYEIINIGDRGGGGRLYQSGTIDMPFTVNIQQAITSGSGGVDVEGTIHTNGRDYTVASREVNLKNAHINADSTTGGTHGNVAIQADTLNTENSDISGNGEVSFDTYTPDKEISFGTPGSGGAPTGLVLGENVFGENGLLKNKPGSKFKKIRIGGDNAGNISVGNVTIPDTLSNGLEIKTKHDVTSTGVMKSVPVLDVQANSVNLTGPNEIQKIGNVTSEHGVHIETAKGTTISGKVTGKTTPINIKNSGGGDVTIASGGQIVGTGTSDVVIEARGGSFKNKRGADAIRTAPGHRYVVHTEDSVENEINGLVFEFRKYGMDYDDPHKPQPPAGKNAMYYKYQPTLKFYSTRAYGDDNSKFFNATAGFYIQDDGNEKRRALDKAEVDFLRDHVKDSGTHHFGISKTTNVNADIHTADGTVTNAMTDVTRRAGTPTYGSESANASEKITFDNTKKDSTGKEYNALNYKIEIDYRIVPRTVTVRGKTSTVNYDGTAHSYTGTNGVIFDNFAEGETATTPGLLSGSVSYTPIADVTKTTGYAQGAVHAGEYSVDLKNSTLSATNYKFKYVPGKLTVRPIDIHFTAPSGERIYGAPNDAVTMTSGTTHTGTLISGDSFAQYAATATDGGNPVTERTGVGSYTMTLSGAALAPGSRSLATDYNITSSTGTLTIKKRPLTITAGDKSRVYGDANATAGYINNTGKVNVGQATATSGLVNGDAIDDVTETIDSAATVTTNAGTTGLWIKATNPHFSSGTAANYDINYVDGHFHIKQRPLTLAAGDKSRIYGTANSTANYVNGTGLFRLKAGNLVNGDSISSVTETIDSRATVTTDAGTAGLKTQIVGAVFGTGNANNYDITYDDGSFAITKRDLTLHAGDKTRIYGTENSTATYTGGTTKFRADAATATTGLVNGDTVADVEESTDALVTTNAGTAGLKTQITNATFGTGKASNYNISYADGGFAVKKRDLYITAGDKSRVYGDANETAHYVNGTSRLNVRAADATTGLVNGDAVSSITETIDPTATVTTDAGTAGLWTKASAAQFSHGTDANYNIHYANGNFAITKRSLTLAAGDKSRIYGTANSTANYVNGTGIFRLKAGNLVNGDSISSVTETIDPRATVTTDAGTAGLKTQIANAVFGTGNANNYDITYDDGSFAITKRDLTLHAGDKTRIYGTENSTATYTGGTTKFRADAATATTGLVNGDTVADVTEFTNAVRTTNVGTAGLKTSITNARFGTGKASNYNISYADGGFAVTKRDLYIKGGDKTRAYGADNATAQYVNGTNRLNVRAADATTGLVNGDAVSSITETIDPTATVMTDAGTGGLWTRPSAAQFSHGTDANYNIHYADGNFAITPREVLVTAGNVTRDYGAPNPVVTAYTIERGDRSSWRGLLAGDAVTGIRANYAPGMTVTTPGGTYTGVIHVDPASVAAGYTGASAIANYRFRYAPGNLTIQMRGFDMGTPEGRVVTTGISSAAQIVAGLTGRHTGIPGTVPGIGGSGMNRSTSGIGGSSVGGSAGSSAAGGSGANRSTGGIGGSSVGGSAGSSAVGGSGMNRSTGGVGSSSVGGSAGSSAAGGSGANRSTGGIDGSGTGRSSGSADSANTGGNAGSGTGVSTSVDGGAGSGTAGNSVTGGVPSTGTPQDTTFADGVTVNVPQDMAQTTWTNRVVVTSSGASESYAFVEHKDGSFGFDLGRTRGVYGVRPEEVPNNTAEAIPVLFTDGGSRDLDGIYTINYAPEKLAIKPASKKVDIPDPKEIRNTSEQTLSFLYQTQNGSFEVTFGNGIVTLYPKNDAALTIITSKDRKAERAVLASGLLTSIEDLGVTPVEIRAVYIFKVLDGQTEGA